MVGYTIAISGKATGGSIQHYFKRLTANPRTPVLFSGYETGGTRGANMLQVADSIKIHCTGYPVRAKIASISGMSSHAKYQEITDWLKAVSLKATTSIQLIYCDCGAQDGLREHLELNTHLSGAHLLNRQPPPAQESHYGCKGYPSKSSDARTGRERRLQRRG